ncbi:MAG: DUF433 domain-containing protein [Chloroflexi bacterium]|nr:DUF433 domain-containing protein [Chloroflexota bacterium]MCC6894625.1 DUF433 domain-containing protein [Anaerolineae bacterium]
MDTVLSINLIATNPQVRNGRPYILGTTLTVADIATAKIYQLLDADGIADYFEIPLQQVHAALAYYYDHKAEIDQDIKQRRELADEMREKRVGSRHKPLFR